MGVWSFEAAEINDTDDLESRPIYRTLAIDEFLGFDKSQKRIISGLKGAGKTLFLKLISHHYRHLGGVILIPATELTERLYSIDFDFSADKAKAWASHERWKHIWRTVLSIVVLKAVKRELTTRLLEIFPESLGLSIGAHLSAAIQSREVNTPKFQELFPKELDSAIQGINQPVALFLDNIDEALARHSGYDLFRESIEHERQSGTHSYELWLSAQIGFVLAARELTQRNAHLKLYGTVRAEAIRDNPTPTAFNIQAMVLDLRYSAAELRGIFETKLLRLRETSPQFFPRPSEANAINAFFQCDTIEHIKVNNADGSPYSEDIFDYLRRHTRGRPRELDFIGDRLQQIPPESRSNEKIREIVRDLSSHFYGFAKNEAVPFWEPRLDILLDKIPSNFISRNQALKIADKNFDKEASIKLWEALRANGLCGAVVNAHPGEVVQRFSNHDSVAKLSAEEFMSASTWVLHPCVNIATRPRRAHYYPNQRNVAGHLYPFLTKPRPPKKHLHVLVGAGKLGFGLVVPMLLADGRTKILIVARKSDQWQPLLGLDGGGKRELRIEYSARTRPKPRVDSTSMVVVTDQQPEWQDVVQQAVRRNRCVLMVTSGITSFQWAISLGDSIGMSVGSQEINAVATQIASAPHKAKVVLGYENDEEGLLRADTILKSRGMVLAPTVVDRICVERELRKEAVIIRAELYGRITALVEPARLRSLLGVFWSNVNEEVQAVSDPKQFDFVREKKKRLVNSLHAAAAALVLGALRDAGTKPETADDVVLGLMTNDMDIHVQLVGIRELMVLSVLGTLPPNQLTSDNLRKLIPELNSYGEQTLQRILGQPDAPSRVLQTDIQSLSAKYTRLFADVQKLALTALGHPEVRAEVSLTEDEIQARLAVLNEAFLKLFTDAGKRKDRS